MGQYPCRLSAERTITIPFTSSPVCQEPRRAESEGITIEEEGYSAANSATYLNDNLVPQQGHVLAPLTVAHLQVVRHLQRFLVRIQADAVLRWEETDAAEHLALPPVRIGGIDDRYLWERDTRRNPSGPRYPLPCITHACSKRSSPYLLGKDAANAYVNIKNNLPEATAHSGTSWHKFHVYSYIVQYC